MMETVGMVRIFQRSLSHRSVRYTSYIGDGDSKTFSSITASNPYGEDITVSKIECVGYVQKGMGTRLRKLKQMSSKLSDGKSIGGKGRLTDRMIDLITTYYGNAIRQNKTYLSDMRKAVWAVYFHIRSSDEEPLHSFCPVGPNSWCKYQNQVVEGSVETFRHSNKLPVAVMDAIKPVFNDLSQPKLLQKCLGGKTQNNNESINSLIWKLCPKTLGCGKKIVDISTNEAIVIFNDGNQGRLKIMQSLGLTVGQFAHKFVTLVDIKEFELQNYLLYSKNLRDIILVEAPGLPIHSGEAESVGEAVVSRRAKRIAFGSTELFIKQAERELRTERRKLGEHEDFATLIRHIVREEVQKNVSHRVKQNIQVESPSLDEVIREKCSQALCPVISSRSVAVNRRNEPPEDPGRLQMLYANQGVLSEIFTCP
ncbi:uncharacterized protein TNCV_2197921 [Trichonephila clavipes]|nr:uncharacterized protein TNCV_2197921 [Trichonephila clavipes]